MAKTGYVEKKVTVAFKPEAEQSEIERVLSQYHYDKVFDDKTLDPSKDRREGILARLYVLSVPAGKEQETVDRLTSEYGAIVEYAYLPVARRLAR